MERREGGGGALLYTPTPVDKNYTRQLECPIPLLLTLPRLQSHCTACYNYRAHN